MLFFSISLKSATIILMKVALNPQMPLGSMDVLIILVLLIHEHEMFFHLPVPSSVSFNKFLWFLLYSKSVLYLPWLHLLLSILLFLIHGSGNQIGGVQVHKCWAQLQVSLVVQVSDRRKGQIQAHKQLQGSWLSAYTSMAVGCQHRCTHGSEGR